MKPLKHLFEYEDFRDFLQDYYLVRKKISSYSYGQLAKSLKLNSSNHLIQIIGGSRNLTLKHVHNLGEHLGLDLKEQSYLDALVLMNQSKSAKDKAYYNQKLVELRGKRPILREKLKDEHLLLEWYYPAVLFFLDQKSTTIEPKSVSKKLGITEAQLKTCIGELKKTGALVEKGKVFSVYPRFFIFDDPKDLTKAKRKYARDQIINSLQALDLSYGQGPKFHCRTFTVNEDTLEVLQKKVNAFMEDLVVDHETRPGDSVIQINVQIFQPSHLLKK